MVKSAKRKNIDYVYLGDSGNFQNPKVKNHSVDYLIIRFLNYGVVKNDNSNLIFKKVLSTCKKTVS